MKLIRISMSPKRVTTKSGITLLCAHSRSSYVDGKTADKSATVSALIANNRSLTEFFHLVWFEVASIRLSH